MYIQACLHFSGGLVKPLKGWVITHQIKKTYPCHTFGKSMSANGPLTIHNDNTHTAKYIILKLSRNTLIKQTNMCERCRHFPVRRCMITIPMWLKFSPKVYYRKRNIRNGYKPVISLNILTESSQDVFWSSWLLKIRGVAIFPIRNGNNGPGVMCEPLKIPLPPACLCH